MPEDFFIFLSGQKLCTCQLFKFKPESLFWPPFPTSCLIWWKKKPYLLIWEKKISPATAYFLVISGGKFHCLNDLEYKIIRFLKSKQNNSEKMMLNISLFLPCILVNTLRLLFTENIRNSVLLEEWCMYMVH